MSDFIKDLEGILHDATGNIVGKVDNNGDVWSDNLGAGHISPDGFFYDLSGEVLGRVITKSAASNCQGSCVFIGFLAAFGISMALSTITSGPLYAPMVLVYLRHLPEQERNRLQRVRRFSWVALILGFLFWSTLAGFINLLLTPLILDSLVNAIGQRSGLDPAAVEVLRSMTAVISFGLVAICGIALSLIVPTGSYFLANWVHRRYNSENPANVRPIAALIELFLPGLGHVFTGIAEGNDSHWKSGIIIYGTVLTVYILIASATSLGFGVCCLPIMIGLPIFSAMTLLKREVPVLSNLYQSLGADV